MAKFRCWLSGVPGGKHHGVGDAAMVKAQGVAEFVGGHGLQVDVIREGRSGSGEINVRVEGDVRVKDDGGRSGGNGHLVVALRKRVNGPRRLRWPNPHIVGSYGSKRHGLSPGGKIGRVIVIKCDNVGAINLRVRQVCDVIPVSDTKVRQLLPIQRAG